MQYNILVADDEREIVEVLRLYLEKDGHRVFEAYDGRDALCCIQENEVDLAILDIMMPSIDGLRLVQQIREQQYSLPILILSARTDDFDKILGLGLGADDYVTKPFNPLEVLARVGALLRRHRKSVDQNEMNEPLITNGNLCLNTDSCVLTKAGQSVPLTSIEYKLLLYFMQHPGRVFTKQQLYEAVWENYYSGDDNTIMVFISKLRDKIESPKDDSPYIVTIRGLGYKFMKKV